MTKFRPQLIPGIFFVIALGILLALGAWQVKRLAWKNKLIDTIAARINQPVRQLPSLKSWKQLDLNNWIYRVVEARGRFDSKNEIHIFTQISPAKTGYSGAGYWVIVPFYLNSGGVVLVNRGFVPEKFKQPGTRPGPQVEGQQTITGIIRGNQGKNFFTPETDFQKNIWYTRDYKAIAEYLKLKNAAPFFISLTKANPAKPLPQPRAVEVTLSNNHLGYALTWFGLALTLTGVFVVFSLKSDADMNQGDRSIK